MEVSTKNSTEESLEKVSAGKPISVYSLNFAKVIAKFPRQRFALKRASQTGTAVQKSLSKKVFSWRNASFAAAILVIGILHFAFQVTFIRSEVTENRSPVDVPPVESVEPARVMPVEAAPTGREAADIDVKQKIDASSTKTARVIRQRETESTAPLLKAQPKKREAAESRAARLRRVERLLTGV